MLDRRNSILNRFLKSFFFIWIFVLILGVFSVARAAYERFEAGGTATIGEFVYDDDFVATTTAGCVVTIYNPAGSAVVTNASMSVNVTNGWYYYNYSIPTSGATGVWPTTMRCGSAAVGDLVQLDKSFAVGDIVVSSSTIATSVWQNATRSLTSFGTLVSDVWANGTRTLTGAGLTSGSLATQADILTASSSLAATIPTAVWSSGTRSLTTFGTLVSDVWANGTRTLTSGGSITAADVWSYATRRLSDSTLDTGSLATAANLTTASSSIAAVVNANTDSQVSSINANTNSVVGTASSSLASVINANTNSQISSAISTINSNVASTVLTASTSLVATIPTAVWANTTRSLTTFGSLVADIWSAATQTPWDMTTSDFGTVAAGSNYLATVRTTYNGTLTDSNNTPTVTLYDPSRNVIVSGVAMTRISTGTYSYSYTTTSGSPAGTWEAVFSAGVDTGKTLSGSDYWTVVSSPAQVIINSISDTVAPEISANVTITNEGLTGYEYQYEWCVVSSIDNACGGGNDTFHGIAAKFINAGEDFNTTLTATVPNDGNYFFKLVVYFGDDSSGASRSFAVTGGTGGGSPPSGGGGGGGGGGGSSGGSQTTNSAVADLNGDNIVNSVDFSILLYFWKAQPPFSNPQVDMNKDGKIDSVDFSILLYRWGQ